MNINKVTIIGYNTYNSDNKFVGGTEMITDTLIKYFMSKGCSTQYFVTRKLTKWMKSLYEETYKCDILSKKELSLDAIKEFNPDLVIVSICSYDTKDICKNIISKIDYCPVLIYGHGPNCCTIKNYNLLNNMYFTYLSEVEHKEYLNYGLDESRMFKIINPVLANDVPINDDYKYDIISNSRIVEQKGIMNAVNLCKRSDLTLAMIGVAATGNKLLQQSQELLGNNLNYLGVVDRSEVFNLVSHSRFLVFLPNAQEGESPLSVLEAMAIGTPVITWDDFGIKNIVNPEYNIILDHSDNYIDQFIEEYMTKISEYLSIENKTNLKVYTRDHFGLKSYYEKLDEIISKIES